MWYVDMVLQWVPLFAFGFNFHRNSMCTSLSHTTRNFNWSSTIDHTDTKLSVITIHNHISISCFLSIYYYLIKVQIKWLIEHNETEQIKHTVIQHNHSIDRSFSREFTQKRVHFTVWIKITNINLMSQLKLKWWWFESEPNETKNPIDLR